MLSSTGKQEVGWDDGVEGEGVGGGWEGGWGCNSSELMHKGGAGSSKRSSEKALAAMQIFQRLEQQPRQRNANSNNL